MQIAGTSQTATTAASTTPVQPLGSPTSSVSQGGNVVMVIIYRNFFFICIVYVLY